MVLQMKRQKVGIEAGRMSVRSELCCLSFGGTVRIRGTLYQRIVLTEKVTSRDYRPVFDQMADFQGFYRHQHERFDIPCFENLLQRRYILLSSV